MPPFPARPNKSDGVSSRGNRRHLKRSSLAEQFLRLPGTIAADPPDAEFTVARGNIRTVNNVLCVRRPDRFPVQSGIEGQPGYRAALEVVNEEVSRRPPAPAGCRPAKGEESPPAVMCRWMGLQPAVTFRRYPSRQWGRLRLVSPRSRIAESRSGKKRPGQSRCLPNRRDLQAMAPARRGLQTPEVERYAIKRSLTEIDEVAAGQIAPKVAAAPNHLDPSRLERKNFDVGAIESRRRKLRRRR